MISVDTKKKELVGQFGRLRRDAGWVSVGCDQGTASFAVESIRRGWKRMGQARHSAVVRGDIHALVYLGERTWMKKAPGLFRVIRVKTPFQGNSGFAVPVHIMQWRQLESPPPSHPSAD